MIGVAWAHVYWEWTPYVGVIALETVLNHPVATDLICARVDGQLTVIAVTFLGGISGQTFADIVRILASIPETIPIAVHISLLGI